MVNDCARDYKLWIDQLGVGRVPEDWRSDCLPRHAMRDIKVVNGVRKGWKVGAGWRRGSWERGAEVELKLLGGNRRIWEFVNLLRRMLGRGVTTSEHRGLQRYDDCGEEVGLGSGSSR